MQYRIYHNIQRPLFTPYKGGEYAGDRLWFDATNFEIPADEDTGAVDLLEPIFERHNRPDRPDGAYAPSLSVGDLVALDWGTENTTFWAVERAGWEQVEGPFFLQVVNAAREVEYFDAVGVVA